MSLGSGCGRDERPRYCDCSIHTISTQRERLSNVDVAVTDRTTFDVNEEGEHELRAALLAIEASAERLSRHRGRLTDQQVDELTGALAHDVRRLRPLLERQMAAARAFDLCGSGEHVPCGRAR